MHNFRYKPYGRGESGDTFTIGHTGNFLLGGKGLEGHKYEDLFKNALRASGLNNQQAAQRLVNALTDATQDPFANLRPEGRQYLTKIVAIIQGSEFRRAAANPLAAIAAFNKVIATPGATLAAALAEATIFGKSEGGAKESQFHRIEQTPGQDFQDRAGAEYDAVAALLKVNGWDGQNEEQFYTTGEAVGVAAMNTFSSSFAGFMME